MKERLGRNPFDRSSYSQDETPHAKPKSKPKAKATSNPRKATEPELKIWQMLLVEVGVRATSAGERALEKILALLST